MKGLVPVGNEESEADANPSSATSEGTEDERKVRQATQMRPGGQVVVFPSKTTGSSSSYIPPPPPTPQQIAAGRRRFVRVHVGVSAWLSIAPYVPWGTFLSESVSAGKGYGKQPVTVYYLVESRAAYG